MVISNPDTIHRVNDLKLNAAKWWAKKGSRGRHKVLYKESTGETWAKDTSLTKISGRTRQWGTDEHNKGRADNYKGQREGVKQKKKPKEM